jgi:hypothetical protein
MIHIMERYDLIGDLHGCADKLKGLLGALGYDKQGGAFNHPGRTAIFVGDIIDPDKYIEYPKAPHHRLDHTVFSRPPVDGTDEEIDQWAQAFIDSIAARSEGSRAPQEGAPPNG